jgi:hypothetical protein
MKCIIDFYVLSRIYPDDQLWNLVQLCNDYGWWRNKIYQFNKTYL